MTKRALLSLTALVFLAPATPCLAQARGGAPAGPPAVAYTLGGDLYLATASGQVVKKVTVPAPIGDFAISPDLKTVVFATAVPGSVGGPFFLLDIASGVIDPMMPDPYFNDDSVAGDLAEFYTDPEFSPDGKQVVFAAHAFGEGSELKLSGPLAFLNLQTRKVTILKSTLAADGFPFGYIRNPHWSPDGKQILGNMEGHAFVTDVEWKPDPSAQAPSEIMIPESEVSQSGTSYGAYAIGWLGSGCVLYQAGEELERDPARIFQFSARTTSPAAEMLRLPQDSLRGLRDLSGPLRLLADPAGYRVVSPAANWLIRGTAGEDAFAHLLPQSDSAAAIPADCR